MSSSPALLLFEGSEDPPYDSLTLLPYNKSAACTDEQPWHVCCDVASNLVECNGEDTSMSMLALLHALHALKGASAAGIWSACGIKGERLGYDYCKRSKQRQH